jgi:hypothetical protein
LATALGYGDPEYDDDSDSDDSDSDDDDSDDSDSDDDDPGDDGGQAGDGYDEPTPDDGDRADPFTMDEPDASDGDAGSGPADRPPRPPGVMGLDDFQARVLGPMRARLNKPEIGADGKTVVPLKLAVAPSGIAFGGARVDRVTLRSLGSLLRTLASMTGQTRRRRNEPAPQGPAKRLLLLELHGHIQGTGNVMRFATDTQTAGDVRGGRAADEDSGPATDYEGRIADVMAISGHASMATPGAVGTLLGEANVLTPRNAYWIGRALSPHMHPGGLIILNSCVAGLAKDDAKSIASQLARGSGCRVAASMGFAKGDIVSGSAEIHAAVEKSGMTFAEIVG